MNRFATEGSEFAAVRVVKNPVLHVKLASTDVTAATQKVVVDGFRVRSGRPSAHQPRRACYARTHHARREYRGLHHRKARLVEGRQRRLLRGGVRQHALLDQTLYRTALRRPQGRDRLHVRVRAVNADGASEWGEQTIRTKVNPLEFAIEGHNGHGIGSRTGRRRRRTPVRLRREGGDVWHTKYNTKAVPFDVTIDLHAVNTLSNASTTCRVWIRATAPSSRAAWPSMDRNTWDRGRHLLVEARRRDQELRLRRQAIGPLHTHQRDEGRRRLRIEAARYTSSASPARRATYRVTSTTTARSTTTTSPRT